MTIQERNDYLNEQSWFLKERQPIFNMESLKVGSTYKNFGQILQVTGISTEERKTKSLYYRDKLDYFLCTQRQKDDLLKITKVKGELVENPFSWKQKSFMSMGYMLEMMIIYILDNHINWYWSKDKWCEALGLLVAKRKDYDLSELQPEKDYPEIFFDTAYDCMKQMAHTRLHDTLASMEKRGIIRRETTIVCGHGEHSKLRPLNQREKLAYEEILRRILHTRKKLDITKIYLYPDVYPKLQKALKEHPLFKDVYIRYSVNPVYLHPFEHSYMREFEFYMYQRRIQKILKPKVLKLTQSRKDEVIQTVANHYRFVQEFPEGCPQEVIDELTDATTLSTVGYWKKRYSRYGTRVRKVVDFMFQRGQNYGKFRSDSTPVVGS